MGRCEARQGDGSYVLSPGTGWGRRSRFCRGSHPGSQDGSKPLIKYGKTGFDSKTHELWQKIAVVNDFIAKKAEKRGKTAKFGAKIVHNRKKVPNNSSITGFASEYFVSLETYEEAFSVVSDGSYGTGRR